VNALLQTIFVRLVFGPAYRMRVWKKMASQISNGMPLVESIRVLQRQCAKRQAFAGRIFADILDHIAVGHTLDIALTEYASPAEIMLISSGQSANRLPEGLRLAVDLLSARRKIISAIIGALAYPCFLSTLCVIVLFVVGTVLIPDLSVMSDPKRWVGAAAVLYAVSSFVTSPWGGGALVVAVALVVITLGSMPRWTGRLRFYADKVPPWSMYRLTVGCVWLFTLATLMRSGMQLSRVLEYMLSSPNTTPYLRERVRGIMDHSRAGRNLGEAMDECGMNFPAAEIVDDMCVYAALPGFHERLYEIAQQSMNDGVENVQRDARLINLACILCIIGEVLCLVLAINSLIQQMLGGF
jgi:type II secretory pathway component PulF